MSYLFEIAYAAAQGRLCLFTGTGFSKAVTDGAAPNWQSLLETLCDKIENGKELKSALFPEGHPLPLSLEESAQVIAIEMSKQGKNIHNEVRMIIESIQVKGNNSSISDFLQNVDLNIVTTNYDKLAEGLAGADRCQSMAPGLPIPRSQSRVNVYHVHGSIDSPSNMVVTSEDYFQFMNSESYFSRKLSTILHESTVVILGYSLGDTNLKAIINNYKGFVREHIVIGNIFFVTRSKIEQSIQDYYAQCYGIRVIEQRSLHDFFDTISSLLKDAKKKSKESLINLRKVLFENHHFVDTYIKTEMSFFEIISSVGAFGCSINDTNVVKMVDDVITRKIKLTGDDGAWPQYEHLARWLVYLASILDISVLTIKDSYLEAVQKSMSTMSKRREYGYSWHAYWSWHGGWSGILPQNRIMIRNFATKMIHRSDVLKIVEQC